MASKINVNMTVSARLASMENYVKMTLGKEILKCYRIQMGDPRAESSTASCVIMIRENVRKL